MQRGEFWLVHCQLVNHLNIRSWFLLCIYHFVCVYEDYSWQMNISSLLNLLYFGITFKHFFVTDLWRRGIEYLFVVSGLCSETKDSRFKGSLQQSPDYSLSVHEADGKCTEELKNQPPSSHLVLWIENVCERKPK